MKSTGGNSIGSLCPSMASADLIGDKWTLLLLREMFLGTTRFSDFQRALPRISPSILSKRLRRLEAAEIIIRKPLGAGQSKEYRLTRSGRELGPIIEYMAVWGLRWRGRRIGSQDYDVGGFMWDFHRTLKTAALPDGETVFHIRISDRTELNTWWILANGDIVDLCPEDPGRDVDVYITASLAHLIDIWMGDVGIKQAADDKIILLDGPRHLILSAPEWFSQSPLANIRPADRQRNINDARQY
ncbi:MAG: HxlR family transcriptional regulator [Robiginitomaculum sp.]|nr:MAG: HxlR family transcriptional regulator [Robiginitomaculum sp.]